MGNFAHACQEDLVVKSSIDDVPYFNAPIYLENKQQVCHFVKRSKICIHVLFRLERLMKYSEPSKNIMFL